MNNTLENKAKFFGQYTNGVTKVVFEEFSYTRKRLVEYEEIIQGLITNSDGTTVYTDMSEQDINDCRLLLSPLSMLTDEDAIEVSRIWGSDVPSTIIGHSLASRLVQGNSKIETEFRNILAVVDFLRLKGYAIPWNGISVAEQIKWGFIILKEE